MKSPTSKVFPAMLDNTTNLVWPTIPGFNRMRRKLGSRLRTGQSPTSNLAKLQTSYNPADTLRSLRAHRWSIYDAQYIFLVVLGIFCLCIIEEPGALVKTAIATLLIVSLLLPVTRQFTLPFLPIASYLVLFYSCRFVMICTLPPQPMGWITAPATRIT